MQASAWSPLDDELELPGKLLKILPGKSGDKSRPVRITKNTKPTKPACAVSLRGRSRLAILGGAGGSSSELVGVVGLECEAGGGDVVCACSVSGLLLQNTDAGVSGCLGLGAEELAGAGFDTGADDGVVGCGDVGREAMGRAVKSLNTWRFTGCTGRRLG